MDRQEAREAPCRNEPDVTGGSLQPGDHIELSRDKSGRGGTKKPVSADAIVRTYNKEVQRQALLVKKARLCETRLTFIQTALQDLFGDENFINLLKAESLETAPKYIRDRVRAGKR